MTSTDLAYLSVVARYGQAVSHVEAARRLLSQSVANPEAPDRLHALATKIVEQHKLLVELASRLQVPPPWLTPNQSPPINLKIADAPELLARVETEVSSADADIRAVQRQLSPPLLPNARPFARAVLIYGGWNLVGWLVQCGLLVATNGVSPSALLTSLCGIPVLALLGSFVTLHLFGQPRVGAKASYFWKMGLAISLLGMPAAWILMIGVLAALRR
jgi:hypothetical protein